MKTYQFKATVQKYPSKGGWYFIHLPKKYTKEIKTNFAIINPSCAWIQTTAKIGQTSWNSSIYLDKKSDCYILPLKAEIRKKENIQIDDDIDITISFDTL